MHVWMYQETGRVMVICFTVCLGQCKLQKQKIMPSGKLLWFSNFVSPMCIDDRRNTMSDKILKSIVAFGA